MIQPARKRFFEGSSFPDWAESQQKTANAEKDAAFQRRAAFEGWSPSFVEKILRQRDDPMQ
ncbi:MAG TPA: hypothetical protein PLX84_12850 [Acidiphilium sp.]|nr:hypothetical protein [Acidiphilium sp.]